MSRVDELRTSELTKLKKQRTRAIARLKQFRSDNPDVNIHDWGYPDGSYRDDINDTGGTVCPSHHVWRVGKIFDRDVYIYELVHWDVWSANVIGHKLEDLDTGEYELAVSDASVVMYHGHGLYIGGIDNKRLKKIDWSIDTIIAITDLLKRFYTKNDIAERMQEKQYS